MLSIHSDRLHLEIAEPGETPNDNSRFDRAGTVTEIMLDKKHRFCASEPNNLSHPSTGGRGLTNAFKLDLSKDTSVGGQFPRLGVGILTKPNEKPYNFFDIYQIAPYPVHWSQSESAITFRTEPIPCQGYAAREEKTLSVTNNTLTMTVRLTNVGEETIDTQEYCHNFVTIDGMSIGPDYRLDIPCLQDQGDQLYTDVLKGSGRGFTFTQFSPKACGIPIDTTHLNCSDRFLWKLTSTAARAGITCVDHFRPVGIYLWYVDHMICMEVFHGIRIQPGESDIWTREWTFDAQ